MILPVGKHLVAVGLDWNLDGQLQDDEVSMACEVYVITADLDADTDRDGTIDDDDEENEDVWTLSRGTLVHPRYMNIPKTPPQFTNLSQIIINGSACPTNLSFRLKAVDTETKNWTEFVDGTNAGIFNSSGYFAISQWPTNLYVAATETRKCTTGNPVCFTIDLEILQSGQILITDRIRLAVAPVILPSECNAAERIYATSTNFLGVIANLEIIPSTASQWVQDQVKFVKTQHDSNTNNNLAITLHHPDRENLDTILQNTNMMPCCQWYVGGEGGNIMATPPLPDAPYGKIMVGSKHGASANQWVVQGIQPVLNITNDWLLVGHVDEILMWAAPDKVLYADPWIAADLLHNEIVAGRGTSTIWWGTDFNAQRDTQIADIVIDGDKKGVVQNTLDESTNTATMVFIASLFTPGDILRMDNEIFAVQSNSANGLTVTVSRAQAGRPAQAHTNGTVVYAYSDVMKINLPVGGNSVVKRIGEATNQLQQALDGYNATFVPVPVLFMDGYVDESNRDCFAAQTANLVNCLVVNATTAYYSDPGNSVFRDYFANIVSGAQPIDAWYMYHCAFGEIHCGTATIRELASQPPWWEQPVQQGQWENLP